MQTAAKDSSSPALCVRARALYRVWVGVSLCVAVFLVVLVAPQRAAAERCDRAVRREANVHKRQGWKIRETAPAEAAKALKTAYDICPDPWYLGHLALLYEKMGRIREAIEFVDAYVDHSKSKQREAAIRGRDRLKALLGRVRVRSDPPAAELLIDGEEFQDAAFTPAVVELDPGDHVVEVSLEDYETARREIVVLSGQEQRVNIRLVSLDEPLEDDELSDEDEDESDLRWTFSLQLGVGVTFPLGSDFIGTALSIPIDIAGGLDLGSVRLELLGQLVIFPDTNGLVLQAGGGLRVGMRLGERPLYLGAELVLGLSQVNVKADGRMIPQGDYSTFGLEPALFLSWQVMDRLELVARPLRIEVMGLATDFPGGTAVRLGLDVGARIRF